MPLLPTPSRRPPWLLPRVTYKTAAKGLKGYNEAIALVQSNDLAGAKKAIAKDNSAEADYLRAVIAVKGRRSEDR